MTRKRDSSGFQRKYLKYTIALLLLALLLSSVGVWIYVRSSTTEAVIDKYKYVTERMGLSLENLYRKSDEVTAECIVNSSVQDSLKREPLDELAKSALSGYFSYTGMEHAADYCYVDNKDNIYTRFYSTVSYSDFIKSGFVQHMGEEYSRTKWFWAEDTLFGTGKDALFIGRYVRSMEYAHEPGMLFFKMDDSFLEQGVKEEKSISEGCAAGIIDGTGQECTLWLPEDYELPKETVQSIRKLAGEGTAGMIRNGERMRGGVLSAYRQADSGLVVFTFVPDEVLNGGMDQILLVLAGIYLMVVAVAFGLSLYFSRRFTRPIQIINEAMTGFDGRDFDRTIELHTNTELDQIGQSYNKMLGNIERLLAEMKEQEKELHTSELNMLISQINPHFLYNTLDTIYMLARINKEETTMRMIQALSKYLRLSLSKGRDIVTIEDELENVKSYMEIQQIRNASLFQYEIDSQVEPAQTWILKLILQPLAENAVKYGFQDIFEGGLIQIRVYKEEGYLMLSVCNNGKPIEAEMVERLNALAGMPAARMKEVFPDKKQGYGVVNIVTRLRLKYGDEAGIWYQALEEGTACVIRVPEERTGKDEE